MFRLSIIILLFFIPCCVFSNNNKFVVETARRGNSIYMLLKKYKLSSSKDNIDLFKKINNKLLTKDDGLIIDKRYILPIQIVKFNGNTIRSTLGITDYNLAKKIEKYNLNLQKHNIKENYRPKGDLWVPVELYDFKNDYFKNIITGEELPDEVPDYSFLKLGKKIKPLNKKLKGFVFYLISGHGGPDPGAIGFREGYELHEDEYAYDITLRLAKKLIESSAKVYVIVQDPNDGIREDLYLKNSSDELLINGDTISTVQLTRLKQRTDLVNNYVAQNKKYKKQILMEIHVDSRIIDKRVDIYFYYRDKCSESEKLCNSLLNTIKRKYKLAQPGRGYQGNVSSRDLFTLRNTNIPASYVELGNIQNAEDQVRLIQPNNRQAIANWLFDGIISAYKK
jgi:N-acetylmuramoyl-L-alanine amidase